MRNLPPESGAVWQIYGTRALVSHVRAEHSGPASNNHPVKQIKTPGLYDLFSENLIWEKEFPASDGLRNDRSTNACRIGHQQIVVLGPEGDLQFFNLQTGKLDFVTPIKLNRADLQIQPRS